MADSSFASGQWETALLCNDISHWLAASLESVLIFQPTIPQSHHEADPLWFSAPVHLFCRKAKFKALRIPALICLWSRQPTKLLYLDITAFLSVGEIATPARIPYDCTGTAWALRQIRVIALKKYPAKVTYAAPDIMRYPYGIFTVPVRCPHGLFM